MEWNSSGYSIDQRGRRGEVRGGEPHVAKSGQIGSVRQNVTYTIDSNQLRACCKVGPEKPDGSFGNV